MPIPVPDEIEQYAAAHTTPMHAVFGKLTDYTTTNTDQPQMQVGPVEGMFLTLIARATGSKRVLEIGTFTGYSALALAQGLPEDGEVITCDIDRHTTAIAKEYWAQHPAGAKIKLELGRASKTIERLDGNFDLVFIDADKVSYIDYWEACVPKVRRGGLLLADNVLWSGRVLDPKDADDRALVAFNKHVLADERVDQVMLTVRDGITMACKR